MLHFACQWGAFRRSSPSQHFLFRDGIVSAAPTQPPIPPFRPPPLPPSRASRLVSQSVRAGSERFEGFRLELANDSSRAESKHSFLS